MNPLEQILGQINQQRAALTGGALAPDETNAAGATAAVTPDTGGALAPDAAEEEDRLAKALRSLRQSGAGPGHGLKGLKKFGGELLGYGEHQDADPGHTGKFAIVKRDGKLFHLFDDGTKMKIDQGAVARALGIRPKRAELEVVPDNPLGAFQRTNAPQMQRVLGGNGTGGASAPSLPGLESLTGGAQAPSSATPRGADPLEELRRLLHAGLR